MHTITLCLKTTAYDESVLDKRFYLLNKCHNILVKRANKLLRRLRKDKKYKGFLKVYGELVKEISALQKSLAKMKEKQKEDDFKDEELLLATEEKIQSLKEEKKAYGQEMNAFREEIGLTKGGLESYISKWQHRYKEHLSSHIIQAEVNNVIKGVDKVLFGNGKRLHFRKISDIHTIASKSTENGIRFYDLKNEVNFTPKSYKPHFEMGIEFLGLDIKISWKRRQEKDNYLLEALNTESLSYCSITRKMTPNGWRYYIILTLKGPAPKKFELGKGKMGGDPGTSIFAATGEDFLLLEELAPDCKKYNKEIIQLQRKIDYSKRLTNPDNYHADGRYKRGKHSWVFSNTCLKNQRRLTTLYRKKSAYIKTEHGRRANIILQHCDTFINEKMDFSALAKRSKTKPERQEKISLVKSKNGTEKTIHKFKKKKRFGKSIHDRAPALQSAMIEQKMHQYGGTYKETNTRTMKASQYDHVTGDYKKVTLNTRMKEVGGHKVQRDLYSAFITAHAKADLKAPNQRKCKKDFSAFLKLQEELIEKIKASCPIRSACFGF